MASQLIPHSALNFSGTMNPLSAQIKIVLDIPCFQGKVNNGI